MLEIYGVIIEVVGELKTVVVQIERRDPDLARQMRRAMCSVALNAAEVAPGEAWEEEAMH